MVPRLVRFSDHATRWNFGEVECSSTRFLDIVEGSKMEKPSEGTVGLLMAVDKR